MSTIYIIITFIILQSMPIIGLRFLIKILCLQKHVAFSKKNVSTYNFKVALLSKKDSLPDTSQTLISYYLCFANTIIQ